MKYVLTFVVALVIGLFAETTFRVVERVQECLPKSGKCCMVKCDCDNCPCCPACPGTNK